MELYEVVSAGIIRAILEATEQQEQWKTVQAQIAKMQSARASAPPGEAKLIAAKIAALKQKNRKAQLGAYKDNVKDSTKKIAEPMKGVGGRAGKVIVKDAKKVFSVAKKAGKAVAGAGIYAAKEGFGVVKRGVKFWGKELAPIGRAANKVIKPAVHSAKAFKPEKLTAEDRKNIERAKVIKSKVWQNRRDALKPKPKKKRPFVPRPKRALSPQNINTTIGSTTRIR